MLIILALMARLARPRGSVTSATMNVVSSLIGVRTTGFAWLHMLEFSLERDQALGPLPSARHYCIPIGGLSVREARFMYGVSTLFTLGLPGSRRKRVTYVCSCRS